MSIYIRGDAMEFVLTGKSDEAGTVLYGHWIDEPETYTRETNRSRVVADGAANEVEATIATLPIVAQPERKRGRR